ncbi:hypothetical protein A9995_08360 [Erythrobacter sp. QSSC1-22B]|nr:hypothetical protein A9995_08360 [Erythrobacter sp. QSSC1-22B]
MVSAASVAVAHDSPASQVSSSDHIAELKACRGIAVEAQRLACFDRSVGAIIAAADSGEVKVVDREDVRETRRSLFGFALPRLGIFGSVDDEEDISMLTSSITGVRRLPRDTYIITIAEGSKWQVNNAPLRLRPPEVGNSIVLKKASLGSFLIRIDGQIGVKGRRIE